MIWISFKRCRRKSTIAYLLIAIVLITLVWKFHKKKREVESLPQVAVLISQRGHSNIPSYISSKHLYKETEALRIQTIKRTGVFASVKAAKAGQVNVHLWFHLCGTNLRSLVDFPAFPNVPSSRKLLPSLNIEHLHENYGKRVFGFIVAPRSSSFSFRIKASGSAELWVSSDDKQQNCRRILQLQSLPKSNSDFLTTDESIELVKSNSYYFEILHKHGGNRKRDFINVEWKFDKINNFEQIPREYLHGFQDDLDIRGDTVHPGSFPPADLKMHRKYTIPQRNNSSIFNREEIYRLPFIPEKHIKDLFPKCPYKPSYIIKHKLERYGSRWENIYSSIYPSDHSNVTLPNGHVAFGNDVLDESEALRIVDMVKKKFNEKGLSNYELQNIINIESKRGRYLVELQFLDVNTKKSVRFSEYLYTPKGSHDLCYPEGFKWNKTSMVHFVVTSGRNQGRWVYHFINNMEKIYQQTKDSFNVIINDFLCPHADLKEALERSSLPHYMLLTNTGKFQKTLGLQQAVNAITDPNGIVVILDLHIDVPSYFVDDVRKHTVLGLQAYSPILRRMECGTNTAVKMGSFWEFHGYGMVGIYKKDWDWFGGMNVEEFKNKWGGEDVEMVDRILMSGYETDRKKIVGLNHYFHSKRGMWNQ